MPATRETHIETIDGQRAIVVETAPPIPPLLQLLLEGGRDAAGRLWLPLRIVSRNPLRLGGTRAECNDQHHRLAAWVEGFHSGSDGVARYLRLLACRDCGSVCVRDVSIDSLTGLPSGRLPLRRRDHVIGWYSGARRNQRVYT